MAGAGTDGAAAGGSGGGVAGGSGGGVAGAGPMIVGAGAVAHAATHRTISAPLNCLN